MHFFSSFFLFLLVGLQRVVLLDDSDVTTVLHSDRWRILQVPCHQTALRW